MERKLHKETVSDALWKILPVIMESGSLSDFRLVGGTSLSLQLGHRHSDDIDMFTDLDYGKADLNAIISFLKREFKYVSEVGSDNFGPGFSCFVGNSEDEPIKLDIYYTEKFIRPALVNHNLRLASMEDIAAMRLDLISNGGRKKDFWDIHVLLERFTLEELISFHREKYPWLDSNKVLKGMTDFSLADEMEDPRCLRGKAWVLIRLDITDELKNYKNSSSGSQ